MEKGYPDIKRLARVVRHIGDCVVNNCSPEDFITVNRAIAPLHAVRDCLYEVADDLEEMAV